MGFNIFIQHNRGEPLFEQVKKQIRAAILDEQLKGNAPLPSIRNLAKELRVSVITISKAYNDLESEGLIYSIPSKGYFVSDDNSSIIREALLRQMEEHLSKLCELAEQLQLSEEEFNTMFNIIRGEKHVSGH